MIQVDLSNPTLEFLENDPSIAARFGTTDSISYLMHSIADCLGVSENIITMPLMFLFFLNNYSAGLSYYYFLSTLFGILITYGIRWSMNDDKILAEMKANLKNPKKSKAGKKTSGWVARLQEIQKEQERQMKKQREEQQRKLRR